MATDRSTPLQREQRPKDPLRAELEAIIAEYDTLRRDAETTLLVLTSRMAKINRRLGHQTVSLGELQRRKAG